MKITRGGNAVSKRGPAESFTGTVWIEEVSPGPGVSDVRVVKVAFEPGARTAWHTHPCGQLLQILSGAARVQKEGAEVMEALPGDTVWIEPGERHWHGATPNRMMVHMAVQRADASGTNVSWQEHVSDADYTKSS